MEFHPTDHVYECIPPVLGIDKSTDPVVIGLKVVTVAEMDAEVLAGRGLTPEKVSERTMALVKSKFAFVRNLTIGGQEVTTFEDFYSKAPPELVRWVCNAVYSTQILSAAERKNSSPGSGSD